MIEDERIIRLAFFFGIFSIVALWEYFFPRRNYSLGRKKRWLNNITVIILNSAAVRFLVPVVPIAVAMQGAATGRGLFNILSMNPFLEAVISFVILDFIIYLQHLMFHAVPLFWRLHMVHHADLGIDVTTGLRFHPIEILISLLIKITVIYALGPSVVVVIIFETALNGTAMFNHGNIYINPRIDSLLRLVIVTPDMHRIHHSVAIGETNSNFGFNLPWWDRLMGTYRAESYKKQKEIIIGLSQYREHLSFAAMMTIPFTGEPGKYAINRWGHVPREPH